MFNRRYNQYILHSIQPSNQFLSTIIRPNMSNKKDAVIVIVCSSKLLYRSKEVCTGYMSLDLLDIDILINGAIVRMRHTIFLLLLNPVDIDTTLADILIFVGLAHQGISIQ